MSDLPDKLFNGYLFTITAGRTGTTWLAEFLRANLGIPVIHEPLGIDDFGSNMPDIRTMRAFNDRGVDEVVKGFWKRKFENLRQFDAYAETNHTLAKCGLVESVAQSEHAHCTTFVVLKRDKVSQCVSYLTRGDFLNVTIVWQWYLSPAYRNIIVNPKPFLRLGQMGCALWYVCEMEARQHYYHTLYGDSLKFIEIRLEDVTERSGENSFLRSLGIKEDAKLPLKKNAMAAKADVNLKEKIANLVASIDFDAQKLAHDYLASNSRLGWGGQTARRYGGRSSTAGS